MEWLTDAFLVHMVIYESLLVPLRSDLHYTGSYGNYKKQ
jgi:hypothetical protein